MGKIIRNGVSFSGTTDNANNINYDNSLSGLEATNVQGAIDGLNMKVNDSLEVNGSQFYFDYQDGKYGFNTDPNRGADTFNPFKGDAQLTVLEGTYISGTKSYNVSVGDVIFVCCDADGKISSTSGLSGELIHSVYKDGRTQMRCYKYKAISTTISISLASAGVYFITQIS